MIDLRRLGLVFMLLPLLSSPMTAQTVTVRVQLVYLKSGKPATHQQIRLFLGVPSRAGTKWLDGTTGADGVAVFAVGKPLPDVVWADEENGRIDGCAWENPIPLKDVMKTGVTIGADNDKSYYGGVCKGDRSVIKRLGAKPGEIVIFVRKLGLWDKLRDAFGG